MAETPAAAASSFFQKHKTKLMVGAAAVGLCTVFGTATVVATSGAIAGQTIQTAGNLVASGGNMLQAATATPAV